MFPLILKVSLTARLASPSQAKKPILAPILSTTLSVVSSIFKLLLFAKGATDSNPSNIFT